MMDIDHVRLINAGDPAIPDARPDRSPAQQHADQALTAAAVAAAAALYNLETAIEWLGVVTTVTNKEAPRYVKKLIEEIEETRRLRQ